MKSRTGNYLPWSWFCADRDRPRPVRFPRRGVFQRRGRRYGTMQRTIRLRPYAIAIILMGLVFAALNYFLVYFVRGIFLRRLEEESLNYASIYRLVKSREAYRAINDLLEQRLLTAT